MNDQLTHDVESETRSWEPDSTVADSLTVDCHMRHCTSEVYERLTVPVDVGGTEIDVCPDCAKYELDVKFYETDREEISASWFTGKTVAAFVAGLSLSLIAFSMMVV